METFKSCHTSSKMGLTDEAQRAVSEMEALKAAAVPDGEEQMSSAQVVAKVLTEDSSMTNTFLKNAGLSLGAPQYQLHQLKGIFGNNLKLNDKPKLPSRNNLQP